MSKRPITFNKPEDPSFLKQIKASIGYKEGPTVETKVRVDTFTAGNVDSPPGHIAISVSRSHAITVHLFFF